MSRDYSQLGSPASLLAAFARFATAQRKAEDYEVIDDDCDRVEYALEQLKHTQVAQPEPQKSDKKSDQLREKGNKCLSSDYDLALKYYTESIATATSEGLTLAFGYANRAVALSRMGHTVDAVADSQRAIMSGYPEKLQYKILTRLGKYYETLKHYGKCLKCMNAAIVALEVSALNKEDQEKYIKDNIQSTLDACKTAGQEEEEDLWDWSDEPQIGVLKLNVPSLGKDFNPEVPSASKNVVLKYNQQYGRHLVATKDFEIGDILLVDEPYSAVLMATSFYTHCSHCLLRSRTLQPCPTCSWAMFCSSACMNAAEVYHKHECLYIPSLLHFSEGDEERNSLRLNIRVITRYGLDYITEFLSKYTPAPCNNDKERRQAGFNSDGKYVSTDINTMINLCSHPVKSALEVMKISVKIANVMKIMRFDNLPCTYKLGGFLFRLLSNSGVNGGSAIKEFVRKSTGELQSQLHYYGICICPTYSLINQNCVGNTFAHFYGKTQVVRAFRTIKKGDQIFIIKAMSGFLNMPLNQRQQLNSETYRFKCNCQACQENWGVLDSLPSLPGIDLPREQRLGLAMRDLGTGMLTDKVTTKNLHKFRRLIKEFDAFPSRYHPCSMYHHVRGRIQHYYLNDGSTAEDTACISKDNLVFEMNSKFNKQNPKFL